MIIILIIYVHVYKVSKRLSKFMNPLKVPIYDNIASNIHKCHRRKRPMAWSNFTDAWWWMHTTYVDDVKVMHTFYKEKKAAYNLPV